MRNSTLCYIERDGQYLMMHRVKKKNDQNQDKWIGIGGGFLEDESPEDCVRREALEETGLTLHDPKLYSVVTFVIENGECEHMFLFKCTEFSGELTECDEGDLEWIDKTALYSLDLWEGDFLFLKKIENDCPFFTLKLVYDKAGHLLEAVENGTVRLK
ncbi:MAG: 8-oxo-dGTP diphosphatase [Clostridia bacterium]|nr:8-oxo-dGTP diphosphatase [Clostridia bacterium]MBQ8513022.1 8-oxo-dGTP diphosphatase [Clostridia bacterium]